MFHKLKRRFMLKFAAPQSTKLHLGCGDVRIPGWCNINIGDTGATDLNDNISSLDRVSENFATDVNACHALEHFSHEEVLKILKLWNSKMVRGAVIRLSVPDLDKIVEIYSKNKKHFTTRGNSPWIGRKLGFGPVS